MTQQPEAPGLFFLGAAVDPEGCCRFRVWAPFADSVDILIDGHHGNGVPMQAGAGGFFTAQVEGLPPNSNYYYLLNRKTMRPDPASRFQPRGVHGPSQVREDRFPWADSSWTGLPIEDLIFYELHTGTFTPAGDFDSIIPRLPALKSLGITIIELMPVAQFPGNRNWGYDGVYPYAVQNSYGGPDGLKRLVDNCHRQGLGVALDVVYNHLGPEGNYLRDFGPYFTGRYKTPWGDALNFDGPESDEVRRFFIENAVYWISDFHIDALRLDAVHAIVDSSATPFVQELADSIHSLARRLGRNVHVVAESDLNDSAIVKPKEFGGLSLDAQWNDDFHHALHALLTRETFGYYRDFGAIEQLATAYMQGFVYSGQYSAYRQRRHGNSSLDVPARRFAVFAQNHDQVGNRALGDRLSSLVSFEKLKLAAGAVILGPFLPLLFMGEEYGDPAPFPYFVSHSDQALIENVRKGRHAEFAKFAWQASIPDPQSPQTFERARLDWNLRDADKHQILLSFYAELFRLRHSIPALKNLAKTDMRVWTCEPNVLGIERWVGVDRVAAVFNFDEQRAPVCFSVARGSWNVVLDSSEKRWLGSGSAAAQRVVVSGESVNIEVPPVSFVIFWQLEELEPQEGSIAAGS